VTRRTAVATVLLAATASAPGQSVILERVDIRGLPRIVIDLAVKEP